MVSGKRILTAFLGFLLVGVTVYGQVPTGRIFGAVSDEEGIPLPGVSVLATSPKLVGRVSAVTDTNGDYRLFALTPGTYKVVFTLQGFKTITREGIVVQIEQTVKLDVSLQMGSLEEEITVIGQSPLIDVKSTVKGMTMTKDMFEVLPRGRDFDTLVTAVPGVNNEPLLAGISVDGASGLENMYYIDGTDIGSMLTGARGQGAVFEFVDEVKINASGYEAEYGGAMGGVVTVVTRQGGNEYHGELIGYYSGSDLTGKERDILYWDPYDYTKVSYINYQDLVGKEKVDRVEAGFSLGGYVLKDRVWFFGSVLPVFLDTTRHVLFHPSEVEGDYSQKYKYYNFQAKLTAQPFRFLRLGVSYVNNFSKYKGGLPNRDGTSPPDDVWADYGYSYPNWTASAYADFTLGNNLLIGLRGGSFYTNTRDQLRQPDGPRWIHSGRGASVFPDIPEEYVRPIGWRNYPTLPYVMERNIQQRSHIDADMTFYLNLAGEHAWKFGVSWVRPMEDRFNMYKYPSGPQISLGWDRSAYVYGVNYGRGKYGCYIVWGNEVTGPFGWAWKTHSDRWALYLQDSWTIADRLTINAGVRTEKEYVPNYSDDPEFEGLRPVDFAFKDKLAPRLGAIYDVFGDSSLKIFGSYGLYFDVFRLYSAGLSYGGYKGGLAYYTLDTYEWDKIGVDSYYPGTLLTTVPITVPSDFGVDPGLKPMSQREFSLGLEKRLMENLSATVRVVQKHLRYAIEDVGVYDQETGYLYYTANPGYGITRWTTNGGMFDPAYPETPKAKREYWGVNFSLDKRLANNWLAGFSYTWSRLTGNYSGLASSDEFGRAGPYVERNFDLWFMERDKGMNLQDGPLSTDRTHFLKLYGAYTFPFRLTVGAVVNAMSGIPFSERWIVNYGYIWRPFNRGYYREGTSGNNLKQTRTPFLWFTNLYAEYSLRLGKTTLNFNINIDNLFNIKTAQNLSDFRTRFGIFVSDEELLSGDWDLDDPGTGYVPDPGFMMKTDFYPPIAVRLGMKFIF